MAAAIVLVTATGGFQGVLGQEEAEGSCSAIYRQCSAASLAQVCGHSDDDLPLSFGHSFCQRFERGFNDFTGRGRRWVRSTKQCLQGKLDAYFRSNPNSRCRTLSATEFESHLSCYTQASKNACNLRPIDRQRILEIVTREYNEFQTTSTIRQGLQTAFSCLGSFGAPNNRHQQVKPLLGFGAGVWDWLWRHRRSVPSISASMAKSVEQQLAQQLGITPESIHITVKTMGTATNIFSDLASNMTNANATARAQDADDSGPHFAVVIDISDKQGHADRLAARATALIENGDIDLRPIFADTDMRQHLRLTGFEVSQETMLQTANDKVASSSSTTPTVIIVGSVIGVLLLVVIVLLALVMKALKKQDLARDRPLEEHLL
ncbi:hypothetical protein PTSG_09770 [Salpingoeca rosetta]|uniref:Secreted protein n=1 Tax=Salpingoeca rosetta (strain ATCC 50818 / BSB-021) TaxID=946362 RepID=F2UP01_SALR5|nr:uncharacterized protein PTSG_09770 [Salpingoeca rosetta]EGD79356.1 hypothetical protein PTSG_09770 [Salpingoeca rosetta]|eukprot:XP_004989125.1 hypothetical protein PTSG_09770 [Salpingoeca rosetta]